MKEIYCQPYETIDWPAQRNNVCPIDIYAPHHPVLNGLNKILNVYVGCGGYPPLRKAALDRTFELVVLEDENTSYQDLGPVNKMMNLVIRSIVDGKNSEAYAMHKLKRRDFMWIGPNGMSMGGTNGSQLWDLVFIVQAIVESGLAEEEGNKETMIKALNWLEQTQIRENPKHHKTAYRHRTKGAWPFSTKEQGYTVSDCTGEGLKSVIYLQEHLRFVSMIQLKVSTLIYLAILRN